MRIMTYAVVGPAIGGVVLFVLNTATEPAPIPFALPALVGVSYLIGWKAAILTGLVMAFVEPRIKRPWLAFAIAALAGGASAAIFFPAFWTGDGSPQLLLWSMAIGGVAGCACAAVERYLRPRLFGFYPASAD